MSGQIISVLDKIEDIQWKIERYNWVSSVEVFYQDLFVNKLLDENNQPFLDQEYITGTTLRIISKSRKLQEISLSNSMLNQLSLLQEPKSTQNAISTLSFPLLKKPRTDTIMGDKASIIEITPEYLNTIQDQLNEISVKLKILIKGSYISQNLSILKEIIAVSNTGSQILTSNSLKTKYEAQIKYKINNNYYSINRHQYLRDVKINQTELITNVSEISGKHKREHVNFDFDTYTILLHPEVIGRLLINFGLKLIIDNSENSSQKIDWNENLTLFDDPLREDGYNSVLFDDEGSLTKAKRLIDNGIKYESLNNLLSSDWKLGGNGFRTVWYHPISHLYSHPLSRNVTNLVLSGGVGKGRKFVEKSGNTLLINRGHGYLSFNQRDMKFVIHANECELWRDGNFIGPVKNLTLTGNLNELLKFGDLSSDQYPVVDLNINASIYIGWLRIKSNNLKIY